MTAKPNEIIAKDRDIFGGTPVFLRTRVPVQALLDFPTLTRDLAVAALELANSLLVCQLA